MKKLLACIFALVLCISLFGCAETGSSTTSGVAESQQAVIEETEKASTTVKATDSTQVTEASTSTETTEASTVTEATESTPVHSDKRQETMVWIPTKGGEKYHSGAEGFFSRK